MEPRPAFALALIMTCAACSADLAADSFRCGRKVVKTGDPVAEILRKCGEPDYRDRGSEIVRIDGADRKKRVERWYYQKSKRRLRRAVIIYEGRIRSIEMVGR